MVYRHLDVIRFSPLPCILVEPLVIEWNEMAPLREGDARAVGKLSGKTESAKLRLEPDAGWHDGRTRGMRDDVGTDGSGNANGNCAVEEAAPADPLSALLLFSFGGFGSLTMIVSRDLVSHGDLLLRP